MIEVLTAPFTSNVTRYTPGCSPWERSAHVRCKFVCSQTGFQRAITHIGSDFRPWRRSAHASVWAGRVEISRGCVIRNCEWILYGHANADTAYSCGMNYIREK